MCEKCCVLKALFEAADCSPHYNYLPSIAFINKMIGQDRIEIYAGDCPIEEVEKHLYEEKHYTICHYLKCKGCGQLFFIGACIRSTPIYKVLNNLDGENINNMLWGHCGSYFNN